jgi:hypothetical protein
MITATLGAQKTGIETSNAGDSPKVDPPPSAAACA